MWVAIVRVALIISTAGSVYRETCRRSEYVRSKIQDVVSDRQCGALQAAQELGHAHGIIPFSTAHNFSKDLAKRLTSRKIDLAISFYTRILVPPVIDIFSGRLINFHPSILPACPGMHGFEDTILSGARFIGSTVHLITNAIDAGLPIIQASFPRPMNLSQDQLRHRIFMQQCRSLVQVIKWYEDKRVSISENFIDIRGASFKVDEFSPNLDSEDALTLFGYDELSTGQDGA